MNKIQLNGDNSTLREIETFSLNTHGETNNLRVISYCSAEEVENFLNNVTDIEQIDIFQDDNIIYTSTYWNSLANTYITYSSSQMAFEVQQTYEHI